MTCPTFHSFSLVEVDHLVEVEYVSQEPESEGLSRDAIIGIAVSSAVAGLVVVVAWVVVVLFCCVLRERKNRVPTSTPPYQPEK